MRLRTPTLYLPDALVRQVARAIAPDWQVEMVRIHYWETGGPEIYLIEIWHADEDEPEREQPVMDTAFGTSGWLDWLEAARARHVAKFGRI